MAFKEYGNYDAVGLAELVRKKQVTRQGIARRGHRPHREGRSADQRGRRQALRLRRAPDRARPARRSLHRRAVPAQGSRSAGGHAHDLGRHGPEGLCRRPQRHAGAALSRYRRLDLRQELQSGIRPDADHGVAPARTDPQSLESRAFFRRLIRRRGGGGCRPHPPRRACQRWRRFDPHPRFRLRRVRPEADPRAQSARPRSRRRLGRLFLRPCRQHQRARQRGR